MHPRYRDRKPASAKVTLSAGPRVGEGHVLDLTNPGCLLQTAVPLERGQAVQLVIYLEVLRPMRITLGIVRWVSERPPVSNSFGCQPKTKRDSAHLSALNHNCG